MLLLDLPSVHPVGGVAMDLGGGGDWGSLCDITKGTHWQGRHSDHSEVKLVLSFQDFSSLFFKVSPREPSSSRRRLLSLAGIILAHVPDGIPALLLPIPGLAHCHQATRVQQCHQPTGLLDPSDLSSGLLVLRSGPVRPGLVWFEPL